MTQRDEVQKFERDRIKVLQQERLHIQKKTFTKWMNSFLQKSKMEVEDLFKDLADGRKLLKLLETISGEKLAKPNTLKMRFHNIENVNKSLAFLHTKVRLESIGAEDIVDGNPRLILGLIWTIILRFQIQEIEIDVDEENESSEKKSAKDALLLWAQRKTHGYSGVSITNFSDSWRSGLGFNALIHSHRPDLFEYGALTPGKHMDNLNHAFDVANNELGIPRLLDAEDIDTTRPDEKSIMTYVASYYHTFARMKNEEKSGRRIAKIIRQMMEADRMKANYDRLTTTLLAWITSKITQLESREDFPNSLDGIQNLLSQFGHYRTQEKPPKYKERSEIEALYFTINTQLKELRQPAFIPADGKLVQDIERAWERLERCEHSREVALRSELRRQERLDQINYKFERKSILRENYLKEMKTVLSDPRYGSNLAQVDATVKKHEAISADILARENRMHDLTAMCEELVRENYRNLDRVKLRENEVLTNWKELLEMLDKHKLNLSRMGTVMSILREIDTTLASIEQLRGDLSSVDTGAHLFAVEELLQKHALQELQLSALGETVKKLRRIGDQNAAQNPKEQDLLKSKLLQLEAAYKDLKDCSASRKSLLEDARNFYQFLQDQEDEEAWLVEKQRICQTAITAKDLRGVLSLQQKHKGLIDEIRLKTKSSSNNGQELLVEGHPRKVEVKLRMDGNKQQWENLERLVKERTKQLQDAAEMYQFYADANEVDSWLHEKGAILGSKDYGEDEPSAQALLQRNRDLQGELNAYSGDIHSLNTQAERLKAAGIVNIDLMTNSSAEQEVSPMMNVEETVVYETKMVPMEVYEDEPSERLEYKVVTEERIVPQVKALYKFKDPEHRISMGKGEVMILLSKSNPDWWCVRKNDGSSGFVPANYVQEIEPLTLQTQNKQPEKVITTQKVKTIKMVKQTVPVKRLVSKPVAKAAPVVKKQLDESTSVVKRQEKINETYSECQEMATRRHALLEDAIRLFGFYRECDDFERWIKDKEKLLSTEVAEESVEQARRKYEKFVTDLSASNKRIESIDRDMAELEQMNHSQIDKVRARYNQVKSAWNRLNELKTRKERSIEGATSVELFFRTCDETVDWMAEKATQLDAVVLGQDLKTVQALQRRHQHLERELAPVEEKVNTVNHLADSVKTSYPHERGNVTERQREIGELWAGVREKAAERRARLEDAVGQQIFRNSTRELLGWVANVKDQLNSETTVRDVQTAEALVKAHDQLRDDIRAHQDEFGQITDLGQKLLQSNPKLEEVRDGVERLAEERAALERGWTEKDKWLRECLELQRFNKEGDKLDAGSGSHEAFLEFNGLGDSLDDVEAYLKQHRAFLATLDAQDDRLSDFSRRADGLIGQNHYDARNIADRRDQVLARRAAVKDTALARTNTLDSARNYQEFVAAAHDLDSWLGDKLRTASDESYRDLANLERKLQKHEAFERELRANEGQLRTVNKLGQALIAQNSYRRTEVAETLRDLNGAWERLVGVSLEKGRRLRQALTQSAYNGDCDEVNGKLGEIESVLDSDNVGGDLRSCRDLLKRHELLEAEMATCQQLVHDLAHQSTDMTDDDHFDAATIHGTTTNNQHRIEQMQSPMARRRAKLEEALEFYMYGFGIESELQWIKEHLPLASSETIGQNLHQAQNLYKKHKKLEDEIAGHQVVIDKAVEVGEGLVAGGGCPESEKVKELCNTLRAAWKELNDKCAERANKLELSLKAQQFYFEANEVESWLNEKSDVLASTDYGRDRDSATKLLTKHKAIELELDTYHSIIAEMGRGSVQTMLQTHHPESKALAERQATLEHQVRSLQRRAAQRQRSLMESLFRHEYFLESAELERWIAEQRQQAVSDDYGQDYEHLLLLQAKFDDFKHRIEAGSERFRQCEILAQKLINNESPYTKDIEHKQQQLDDDPELSEAVEEVQFMHEKMRAIYQDLRTQIANRDDRLHAAGEIHRFHRDVSEALSRIHEKSAALGTELGRDLNSALALLRRQEAFENELVVLEAQLQVLVDDAGRLGASYPSNKGQLQQKQELVVRAWQGLKERADMRRDQLQASVDLQKFLTQVRDLTSWASGLRAAMNAEETVRSAARAQLLRDEHEALKGEIEAREQNFQAAIDMSDAMQQTGHYAADEAVQRCDALFHERDKLHLAWNNKKHHLAQLIDLHMFLREAKQIESTCNAQEAALVAAGEGAVTTVDEVRALVKKHDEFERLFSGQDERLDALLVTGDKLITQKHFEGAQIASRLADIQSKRIKIKKMCAQRRHQLEDALLYGEFNRDVSDTRAWIQDKQKTLDSDLLRPTTATPSNLSPTDIHATSSLEDKIRTLKKHQAFRAEIAANEGRVREIRVSGDVLLRKRHQASTEIGREMMEVESGWERLMREVGRRGKGLEEAQELLEFSNQLDKIEAWIREKEVMIQAADTGRDYEHCLSLTRKLDDVDSDMRVDDARIKSLLALADKLLVQPQTAVGVAGRRDAFLAKWARLQGALGDYRGRLAGAMEVHLFNRDVDDTVERVAEKRVAMEVDDVGKDVGGVEGLQRKQDALVMEMSAVEDKLHDHQDEAKKLSAKYKENRDDIYAKVNDLQMQWQELLQAKDKRKEALLNNYIRQKFLADVKEMELWSGDLVKRMQANTNTDCISLAEAEAQLELHAERKAEIDGRQPLFAHLIEFGKNLLSQKGDNPEIKDGVRKLEDMQDRILDAWNEHKQELDNEYQLQGFKEQMDQLELWLTSKEAHLHNDDLGDRPRAVETLIRKHQDFQSLLEQQLTRVEELREECGPVLRGGRRPEIAKRLEVIAARRDRLVEAAEDRRKRLEESRDLHGFIRRVHDVEAWLGQVVQIASDENYRDPSNLQGKIQKHQTFEVEIQANSNRIHGIIEDGQKLIANKHFASEEIKNRTGDLNNDWKQLQEMSQEKRERLSDAYQALLFNRSLDEFESWLREVEAQAQSNDYGKDLITVTNISKKHLALENDVLQHSENCDAIHETSELFIQRGHFMCDELQEQAQDVITRYHQLREPLQSRRDQLEAAGMLHQFTRDVDDELQWLADRLPLAASQELGGTLTAVNSLQKKHQVLETELASREPIVTGLVSRASHLTRSGHKAGHLIDEKATELRKLLTNIRDMASVRKLRLQDALESQTFYAEAAEAETWINEKRPLLSSGEIGKDEDSAQSLLRKLEALNCEVEGFELNVQKLAATAKRLVERQHFDSANIAEKQETIQVKFSELQTLLANRDARLAEALAYFGFLRECSDVQEWMADEQTKAASEDYGTDVEHVQLLTQAFETFLASLMNSEQRVLNSVESGKKLVKSNSGHSAEIEKKVTELNDQWRDLMELAYARKDALAGARQVHLFDRTADETIAWIQEKDAVVSVDIYDQDLESLQALLRNHTAFESELQAVKEQVESVETEATALIEIFPDTEDHINVKREDVFASFDDLQVKSKQRRDNLQQAEQLQTYFDDYQELLAFINEMLAKITSPDLPTDVTNSELLIHRHREHKTELDTRLPSFTHYFYTGDQLINSGHFMSAEITARISNLQQRLEGLQNTWRNRESIYEQNLDVQLFKREAALLEHWLVVREGPLRDGKLGESIVQVEDLLRKHEDFEKTIVAQEDKFQALRRKTMVEEAFAQQLEDEAKSRQVERERLEQERQAQRKRQEMQRITEQRRQEEYRDHRDRDHRDRVHHTANNNEERVNGNTLYPPQIEQMAPPPTSTLTKSNSVAHMFGNPMRRASDVKIKRAESMKVTGHVKQVKRTPSFNTKRRSSLRGKNPLEADLPPVEVQGTLDRKQVQMAGGKKATNRGWKNLYTVLCGQLLCFFKNKEDFAASKAICPPVGIHNAQCTVADDYNKKKYTFRLVTVDQSEFLFSTVSDEDMMEWIRKISFRARLPPSQQLLHFEVQKEPDVDLSSQSSRTSSPDVPDSSVVLRQDPQFQNGNSQHTTHRHTFAQGESPPPLPMSQPPPNNMATPPRRYNTLDNTGPDGHVSDGQWSTSSMNRPVSLNPSDQKKSSRIMDLFRKKRHPTSQM